MNLNPIEMKIHGIKCDVCDYKDMDIKVEEYESYIDKPCPKCGENLLTQSDHNNVQMLMKFVNIANNILPPRNENEEVVRMSVELNGTGDVKFKIEDEDDFNE